MSHSGADDEEVDGPSMYLDSVLSLMKLDIGSSCPTIPLPVKALECEGVGQMSLKDHIAFDSFVGNEMQLLSRLEALASEGQYHVNTLYTYRSVAKAIPSVG